MCSDAQEHSRVVRYRMEITRFPFTIHVPRVIMLVASLH